MLILIIELPLSTNTTGQFKIIPQRKNTDGTWSSKTSQAITKNAGYTYKDTVISWTTLSYIGGAGTFRLRFEAIDTLSYISDRFRVKGTLTGY